MKKIKNYHTEKTVESAENFNRIIRKKRSVRDSKVRKNKLKIAFLEKKVKEIKDKNYVLDSSETNEKIGFEFEFNPSKVDLDLDKVEKVAKLGYSTIYKINGKWNVVRGKGTNFDDVVWSLREVTPNELYWKLDEYN